MLTSDDRTGPEVSDSFYLLAIGHESDARRSPSPKSLVDSVRHRHSAARGLLLKDSGRRRNPDLQMTTINPTNRDIENAIAIDTRSLMITVRNQNVFARIDIKWIEPLRPPLDR